MKRVVITGYGIVCSLGNNKAEVLDSLQAGKSGIVRAEEYAELEMRSRIHGAINIDAASRIDRKLYRFMGDAAAYSYIAMEEAIEHSAMPEEIITSERTGLLLGTGGASPENIVKAADTLRQRGVKRSAVSVVAVSYCGVKRYPRRQHQFAIQRIVGVDAEQLGA